MVKALQLALMVIEATSIPLLVLTYIYILSGYQLLYPEVYIMPVARVLHTDIVLRVLFTILVYLHSLSGLMLMVERRVKKILWKRLLEYIAIVGLSVFTVIPIMLDAVFR